MTDLRTELNAIKAEMKAEIERIGSNLSRQRQEDRESAAHHAALTRHQLENVAPESLRHAQPGQSLNTAPQRREFNRMAQLEHQVAQIQSHYDYGDGDQCGDCYPHDGHGFYLADNTQNEPPPRPQIGRFGGGGNRGRPAPRDSRPPNAAQPPMKPRVQWNTGGNPGNAPAPRFGQMENGDARTPRFGQQVAARQRYPKRDTDGRIIMRLLDKPATIWREIDDTMKQHLGASGFKNEKDWQERGDTPCGLCGPDANHWWNRCVRVWGATDHGRRTLGVAKAAERVRQALAAEHAMNTVGECLIAFQHANGNGEYGSHEEVNAMLEHVADAYNITVDDDADDIFTVCCQLNEPYGVLPHPVA